MAENSSVQNLSVIKKRLVQELGQVKKQLDQMETANALEQDTLPEVTELGSYAWQADVQSGYQAIKDRLTKLYSTINKSLVKLKTGTYGLCEKCHKQIHWERLNVFPMANSCTTCL